MNHTVKILSIEPLTHDVHAFKIEKPAGYSYTAGQATEVAINKPGWENEKRPFSFTSLKNEEYLELIIKSYKDHKGVTNELLQLHPGDELTIGDAWGAIGYKDPGYFIAGGAGITPFIAILRELAHSNTLHQNQLFFSNKTTADIILKDEMSALLGGNAHYVISHEPGSSFYNGYIDERYIRNNVNDFSKHFYVCGPEPMIESINRILIQQGASPDTVVFEK